MKGAPRSSQFDDVYFSVDDGLAETRHVFMQGNDLPHFWQEKGAAGAQDFVIAETGFGTGLNFLCAWKEFCETAPLKMRLDFVSFEKFPLSKTEIQEALEPWQSELGEYADKLLEQYPIRVGGFHRIVFDSRISLTLIFGDVNEYIPELEARVDCWFLDGFTPAKNPDMWSDTLYRNMARLSYNGTRFATFTAAGDVRRGLAAAGFHVEKRKGFGRKRDMIVGHYAEEGELATSSRPTRIAIIGGGLAGTSCAYVLKQYGFEPVIYETSDRLASGASGNEIGLYNPRFTALRGADSEYYSSAYAHVIRMAGHAEAIEYSHRGTLHLISNEDKDRRFSKLLENWHWHGDHIKRLSKEEASDVAGITLDHEALYLPDAGTICPYKLCVYYAKDIDIHFNHEVNDLSDIDADAYVLANGIGATKFEELPIHTVRGQVTIVKQNDALSNLRANICYSGYITAGVNERHAIGSTFQKWLEHSDILDEDDADNITRLKEAIPSLGEIDFEIDTSRAALRVSSKDRFPITGRVPNEDNIYLSTAFGSHGIVGSLAAAYLIADQMRGGVQSLPKSVAKSLSLQRFIDRAEKKRLNS
ncbi:MAG: bifunctional tRNA (5-methylaminomethyl-2-thiouridine)(34)-methyltransferase MnmD/FAD-dependent 5-carboxymethylaminomethyl-2-thiouridine(34) oxidoreductase MnmC [Alphaproteobacteria bacterium]|nr:bifunctional tRNA (5-methylaminomethyl-2-thiouridine)(34)-methyltransferase MnmD/FAD-dependent 5-carboxymethylaminomethyl-2-thiouridine(34) oxidoreductase MnmC [Alphaproteobacteria bacterium]